MDKRSRSEVDALWPKGDIYVIMARIAIPLVTTPEQAAAKLRPFYDGQFSMAGRFEVKRMTGRQSKSNVFEVAFYRDVCDDYDVVDERLLDGKDFNDTLCRQLRVEFNEANEGLGDEMHLILLDHPTFPKAQDL